MVVSTVSEIREYMAGDIDCRFCLLVRSSLNLLKEGYVSKPTKAFENLPDTEQDL